MSQVQLVFASLLPRNGPRKRQPLYVVTVTY